MSYSRIPISAAHLLTRHRLMIDWLLNNSDMLAINELDFITNVRKKMERTSVVEPSISIQTLKRLEEIYESKRFPMVVVNTVLQGDVMEAR